MCSKVNVTLVCSAKLFDSQLLPGPETSLLHLLRTRTMVAGVECLGLTVIIMTAQCASVLLSMSYRASGQEWHGKLVLDYSTYNS